jgi:hypothetical protein
MMKRDHDSSVLLGTGLIKQFPGERVRRIWVRDHTSNLLDLDIAIGTLQHADGIYHGLRRETLAALLRMGCQLRTRYAWFMYESAIHG